MENRMLRWKEVQSKVGNPSRVTVWRWEKAGYFPKRRAIGPSSVGWLESEVNGWLESRETVEGGES